MTFLNPFVLFGLAAAAIPVLLHLLNLRKLRTIEFSSIRFLKELQKTSMRRLRIRQILLLIVRTLLIIAVVMAFSRPALRVKLAGFGNTGASSTMIVILDDSPSMAIRDERGTSFTRAVQTASGLIDLAADGDRLYLVPLSGLRPGSALPAPRVRESAREALGGMSPSPVSVPLGDALAQIRPLLAASPDANREVIFISDGQASQLQGRGNARDSAGTFDPRATLFLCSSPPLRHDNTGVTGGEILTKIVSDRKPVQFQALLSNPGDQPVQGTVASLYADGARVAQRSVDIPPGGETRPIFPFTVKRRGILGCSVQIEDDGFDADNTYSFVLEVPEHINVLLTGPSPGSTRLATLALTLGGDSLLAGNIAATQGTNAGLASADLARFDAIVICGCEGITGTSSRNIARFVSEGGGLILFPGAGPTESALFRDIGLPAPGGAPVTVPAGGFVSFSTVDYAHPLFEGLFDTQRGKVKKEIESPRITTSLPITAGEKGTRVIGLTNGNAFLTDYRTGTGRVLLFAVEAGTGWSDFPVTGIFAPLIHRAVAYTGSRRAAEKTLEPGDPIEFALNLRSFTDRDTYTLTTPDGHTRKVVPDFQAGTGKARFSAGSAQETGIYRLARDAGAPGGTAKDIAALAVNLPPRESDLKTATGDDIEKFRARARIAPGRVQTMGPERAAETLRESRYGVELWKDFALLAALLAVAEMALGRVAGTRGAEGDAG